MDILRPYFKHYVLEFSGVDSATLHDAKYIDSAVKAAILEMEITVINSIKHEFTPQGLTMLYLLSASHLAIHTWPEYKYAHMDIMTCSISDVKLLEMKIKTMFNPRHTKISEIEYT